MTQPLLIYGANGYTGRLIVEEAVRRGLRPIVAGRNSESIEALASSWELPARVFTLEDPARLSEMLQDVHTLVNCAGPFYSRSFKPLLKACMSSGTHYLDITGEVDVFEEAASQGEQAAAAGIVVMPGVGFDVVPTDCLAAHLKRRVPDAVSLSLGFSGSGGVSHGTAMTMVENISEQSLVRREGVLVPIASGSMTRQIDFGRGPRLGMAIPWGDVSTAFYSTAIPNIEVYMAVSGQLHRMTRITRHLGWLLGSAPVQYGLRRWLDANLSGPSEETRRTCRTWVWGEVTDAAGETTTSRMETPEAYTLTAQTTVLIAGKVLRDECAPGFHTPSTGFGADLILEVEDVIRRDEA